MTPSSDLLEAKNLIKGLTPSELLELKLHIREHQLATCRLLGLPAELRNRVYYFVALNVLEAHVNDGRSPSLLRVCRQARQEFSSLYFSDTTMTLDHTAHEAPDIPCWRPWGEQTMLNELLAITWLDLYLVPAPTPGHLKPGEDPAFRILFGNQQVVSHFRLSERDEMLGDTQQARELAHHCALRSYIAGFSFVAFWSSRLLLERVLEWSTSGQNEYAARRRIARM